MSRRGDKMYKDSPTVGTNEDGKKVVKKGPSEAEKKTEKTDAGTEGMPEHDKKSLAMHHKHAQERMDLHQKHEKDHQMHSKPEHAKAVMELHAKHEQQHQAVHSEHMEHGEPVGTTEKPKE